MIYLDNAATTRPNARALERASAFLSENFYNPSARYRGGDDVFRAIKESREFLIGCIADVSAFELIFTSCGTEADNQAVFSCGRRGNVVCSQGEHAAVYASCTELKNRGVEPRFAKLNRDGSVNVDALLDSVDGSTSLVSVLHVNNETGAVNDIADIAKRVKRKNPRTIFHSDGVQAFGKIPVRLTRDIDLYSVSAHKIGALKGTGALIKRKGSSLSPFIFGGGQEGNLRSGTENVYGIACFRYAAEEKFASLKADGERLKNLRELLWELLEKPLFCRISPLDGSPYILTVSAQGLRGEVLQRMLWDRGVAIGTGSACNSKKPHSRVIAACGYEDTAVLDGVLRASFSPETTEGEIRECAAEMNRAALELKERMK